MPEEHLRSPLIHKKEAATVVDVVINELIDQGEGAVTNPIA